MKASEWLKLIENNHDSLCESIVAAWEEMLLVEDSSSMKNAVILHDDGEIEICYRDQNSFGSGEFECSALCICEISGQYDDCWLEEDATEEDYICMMKTEYPIDPNDYMENVLRDLQYDD